MAIIFQHDKRSGITYAYEATYKWNKEKKQSRSKRTLIGRVDADGNIVPTDGRCKKNSPAAKGSSAEESVAKEPVVAKKGPAPAFCARHLFYGATYLLDEICESTGVAKDLRACFPDTWKQMLSIAYYLILEDNNPLYRFEKWGQIHHHPYGKTISSPRSSEFFSEITDQQIQDFFRLQGKRRIPEEYWAYDSTTISSYSETLRQVQYGKNKENDNLPQLNLLLVFGEKSGLPFYYRKLAGNIPDAKTVKHLLADLNILGFGKTKVVMDRGFYSEKNVNALYQEHVKFLLAARTSLSFVRKHLDAVHDDIRMFPYYDENFNGYGYTVSTQWDYRQERPYKKDTLQEKRRIYIHLYYSIDKGAEAESAFDRKIASLYKELLNNDRKAEHAKQYEKYFTVKQTSKGVQVIVNEAALKKARKYLGYFALITNEKMDAFTALQLYRMKDVVEKAFGNIKERLNMRRLLVSSERGLDGKLFVEFVALILISYIHQRMKAQNLYKKYTMHQLLDKLDVIECFEEPGHRLRVGELLVEQHELYQKLGVEPPTSL
ncbi:IS1634 family transposase [Desulfosarcina sp. OttesenSCG-928-G10]|nr:IS1634 family transposase [Desulfosarcina sp. OttesenSCG-928-G10]MDL2322067.1 IS1634 family transposase [Desulfosarcina sp. OttesenSCG-928-B08]